jgi:hypothetical protein
LDAVILARRRPRRAIERRRRAARRRRNFLLPGAAFAFVGGIALGAGHAEPTQAGSPASDSSPTAAAVAPRPGDVPTLSDFDDPVPVLMYQLADPGRPYELSRIRVEPGDGAEGLAAKLEQAGA